MIVFTVLFTVLLIEDCVDEPGVETLIPLGNLSDDFPEKPLILLNFVIVNGWI